MANILFYVPFNQRSRDNESLMIALRGLGHQVICLNQLEGRDIHTVLERNGVKTHSHLIPGQNGWIYHIRQLLYFIRFCRRHRIDIVISHLEPANFVASIGQYFTRARTVLCRHHVDEAKLYKFDQSFGYHATYQLARTVVAVSERARKYLIDVEKMPSEKVVHINLGYDFSLYQKPNAVKVQQIIADNPAAIRLVAVCRLTRFKRPEIAIELLSKLIGEGMDARLILVGSGDMEDALKNTIASMKLGRFVVMTGHVDNVLDYMAASDFLIHPSVLDSSSVVLKEAGLTELVPIVCRGVGDADEYITNGVNGFVVDADHFVKEAVNAIKSLSDTKKRTQISTSLRQLILSKFDINVVIRDWQKLLKI